MLVVIPTYRRNECLRWVLQSLVQSSISGIPEVIRILVVNNYPPAATEITKLVDEFRSNGKFEWHILFRDRTLDPVDNWYSAIFDNAQEDEVVCINSDDDLLLPLSLKNRYDAIVTRGSDVVLGRMGKDLFFSQAGAKVYCPYAPAIDSATTVNTLGFQSLLEYAPWHLSNHCYRNTKKLRMGYEQALRWCEKLDWLDKRNRTIYMPLYLPMSILMLGGVVLGLATELFMRGRDIDELRRAPYGVANWNHGFVHGCAWIILNNEALVGIPELDAIRAGYRREYVRHLPTYLFDSRLDWRSVMKTARELKIGATDVFSNELLYGLRLQFGELTGLRGYRLLQRATSQSLSTEAFLGSLNLQYLTCPRQ
jgi:hypothetical protein